MGRGARDPREIGSIFVDVNGEDQITFTRIQAPEEDEQEGEQLGLPQK